MADTLKDLQAKVAEQDRTILSLQEVTKHLNGRISELNSKFEMAAQTLAALSESDVRRATDVEERFKVVDEALDALRTSIAEDANEFRGALFGYDGEPEEDESDEQRATRVGALARVTELEALVRGRNRSAPVKRNMTDADAVEVLQGEASKLEHKEAGEKVGLTYAQVYSCRLEYTFKHVHKELRAAGWKNPWVKK